MSKTGIDWTRTQRLLANRHYDPSVPDGDPGRMTYTALFAFVCGRQPDAVLRSIGAAAARGLPQADVALTAGRLAEFLAETCVESAGYSRFEENLRYSARRLTAVWPSRFPTLASARPYAWDPSDPDAEDRALADLVYGGRMGNEKNGVHDDDGWLYRGRGLLDHTGAAEYALLKSRLGLDPDDVSEPAHSVEAALDYWGRARVTAHCDACDWAGARRSVNGGLIGLDDVAMRRARALEVLDP